MSHAHTRRLRNEVNLYRRGPVSIRVRDPKIARLEPVKEWQAVVERLMNSPPILREIEDATIQRMLESL